MSEINIAGVFNWVPALTDDQLIAEFKGDRWEPATDDFAAVAGGRPYLSSSFGQMLGAIWEQPVGKVERVNVLTHGSSNLIAFAGHIEKRTISHADVFLNLNGSSISESLIAMDVNGMDKLGQPGVTFTMPGRGKKKPQRMKMDDVRKRFAKEAMIALYACHSGVLPDFLKSVAAFFKVKVIGFTAKVLYYPPPQNTPHRFIRQGMKIGLEGIGPVENWRKLIGTPKIAVTVNP